MQPGKHIQIHRHLDANTGGKLTSQAVPSQGGSSGVTDHAQLTGLATAGAHTATAIAFTPNGSIAATDVQTAIQEVRDEAVAEGMAHYEVLMDGAGAPLDNGSGLDWLYVWVP